MNRNSEYDAIFVITVVPRQNNTLFNILIFSLTCYLYRRQNPGKIVYCQIGWFIFPLFQCQAARFFDTTL
jgi:hypothetical protein